MQNCISPFPLHSGVGADVKATRKAFTTFLKCSLYLTVNVSSGSSFQWWGAVGKNVVLWPAVFQDGIIV